MNKRQDATTVETVGIEAVAVETFAATAGVGRGIVYRAISTDPALRRGLPYLPSLKIGHRRLVRVEAGRAWLLALEAAGQSTAA
jgi:hypothetical protein